LAPVPIQEVIMKIGISFPSIPALFLAMAAGGTHAGECPPQAGETANARPAVAMPEHAFYYNPWADFARMQAVLNGPFNVVNPFWMPVMYVPPASFAMPTRLSAIQQTKDGYQLTIPLPGFKPEDIHVRLDGQLLSISAQTSSSLKVGQKDVQGTSSRSFAETLTLPWSVQASELKESFKDGVLTLTLPGQKGTNS
jgi:HSP20 family molecular chaperone IbpA